MFRKVIDIKTTERIEIIDITHEIQLAVEECNYKDGLINIHSIHSTSSIAINENEQGLLKDFKSTLESFIPHNKSYNHNCIDNNADSHIKAFLIGSNETIPLNNGKIGLGTWQSVFFVEFDGPRKRQSIITII